MHRCARWSWLLLLALASCGRIGYEPLGESGVDGSDLSRDAAIVNPLDAGLLDLPPPAADAAPADLEARDLLAADAAPPADLALADRSSPDLAQLDLVTPDLALPDLAAPDMSRVPSLTLSTVIGSSIAVASDGKATGVVRVTILDDAGLPLADHFVDIVSSRGATDDITALQIATDATGVALFTVDSLTSGAPSFSATVDGAPLRATGSLFFTIDPNHSTATGNGTWIEADGVDYFAITAQLRDGTGTAVSGRVAKLSSSRGVLDLAAPATSSGTGIATLHAVSTTPGAATLSVSVDGVSIPGSLTTTFVALNQGLRAYYKFDGDFSDATGLGPTLVATPGQGTSPSFRSGVVGSAFFGGICSGACDGLSAFGDPQLDFTDGGDDFTLSVWVQHYDDPTTHGWGCYAILASDQVLLWASSNGSAYPAPSNIEMRLSNGATLLATVTSDIDVRTPMYTNEWIHVLTWRAGGQLGLRINGGTPITTTVTGSVGAVGHGGQIDLAGNFGGYIWEGVTDELGKWNRALSSDEQDALYNNGLGRTLPAP